MAGDRTLLPQAVEALRQFAADHPQDTGRHSWVAIRAMRGRSRRRMPAFTRSLPPLSRR